MVTMKQMVAMDYLQYIAVRMCKIESTVSCMI